MATYTTNLNLKKPDSEDFYNIQDFNDNADILDTSYNLMSQKLNEQDEAITKYVNSSCILECNYEKVGTVHKLTTDNTASENIKFYATSDFKAGDTFTFNGTNIAVLTQDGEVPNNNIFVADTMVSGLLKDDVLYLPCSCSGRPYVFTLADYDGVDLNNLHGSYTAVEYIVPYIDVNEYQASNFPPVQNYTNYGFHFKHLFGVEYFRSFYDYKLWMRVNDGSQSTAWVCISAPPSD